jgi:very-short-patch-repair endonuclease
MTDSERKLWAVLRANQIGFHFRRQVPIGKYIVDFLCWKKRLIIEVDGSQHYTDIGQKKDKIRDDFLFSQKFKVLRFSSYEVLTNIEGVVTTIIDYLKNPL